MAHSVVIVHTVVPLVASFDRLAREYLPGVKLFHVLDEPLLEQIRRDNGLLEPGMTRLCGHIRAAEDIGAEAVLVSCSSVSPYLDRIHSSIPLVKIDAAMLALAVEQDGRVGVLATNPTTLGPTRQGLEQAASARGKTIIILSAVVEGAFAALMGGDNAAHDRLVAEEIDQLAPQVDRIVLAQASMARVLDSRAEWLVPVLTSPHTALAQLQKILAGRGA
jgi:aspartate/glutamate racemase